MKKNLVYLLVFVLLMILAYFLVFKEKISTLGEKDSDFPIENPGEVYKIFMADMLGKKALLERTENGWLINGKYKAREDGVNTILTTLNKIKVFYPVPKSAYNTIVAELASTNTKVELYNKKNKKIKSYFVGGPTMDHKGTYMMLEGASQPYVVHIPGFDGYMTPRFFLDEEEWRDRAVFIYSADNLKSVSIAYAEMPENSFKITLINSDSFEVVALHPAGNNLGALHIIRVKQYLARYSRIYAEAFENNNSKKDSVLSTSPYITMTVTDVNGKENQLKIYHMPINERSKSTVDEKGNPLKYDLDRMYALHNNQDFMLIQTFVFGKLWAAYRNFYMGVEK